MKGWIGMAWRPALLLAGLIGAGFALHAAAWRDLIAGAGQHGPMAYLLIGAAACAIGIPRQVVAYAGGLAWGFWPGVALGLVAQLLGCAATLLWSRLIARRWAERWLHRGTGDRMARLDAFIARHPFTATLVLRLLPVGSNPLLNLLAGVSAVPVVPFLAASALGYLPQTVIFALLGGGVRLEQEAQVGIAVALFALSLILGTALLRRERVLAEG